MQDLLTGGEEVAVPADLVVLVTGMDGAANDGLTRGAQAAAGRRPLLQRDPPQAAAGGDGHRRRLHRRLPARRRRTPARAWSPRWRRWPRRRRC
ncbi:MAG: hypothetical protein MZV70_60145 [Desulfobacterales bacterium]|nr:hypothetical protein [Desulfobacterales bacterium]